MSNNNPPPTATQIHSALQAIGHSIRAVQTVPGSEDSLTTILTNFAKTFIAPIVAHDQLYPSCPPPTQPSSTNEELKKIQSSLQALSKGCIHLYAFGTHAMLRKWKQHPTQPPPPPPPSQPMDHLDCLIAALSSNKDDETEITVTPSQLPLGLLQFSSEPKFEPELFQT
ncbi:hypothetical protein F5888DRAFT_1801649 [Russula emetica]|nr:hypothetical protein F5888DRAFT_1801649 [Russula emetica]